MNSESAMNRILTLLLILLCGATAIQARKMSDLKIYINPGHGGYTSNDRPIHIYPYAAGDSLGYWESKSNLYKGLHMYHLLDSLGSTVYISRIKNTEDDDRSLSGICAEANALGVDMLLSIHSNAGETVNYPLMLYREETLGVPRYPEAINLSKIVWRNLHSSKLPVWTRDNEYIAGDLTFYQSMWSGGLGVLRTLYTVGLLSEGSMHEHRPEAHRLMNDDVWYLEAWHFVKSIMEFYNTEDRFVNGNVAGVVYDDHRIRESVQPANFTRYGRDKLAPVNGASVELVDASGNVVQRRTTDGDYNGVYVFRSVEPGQYTVRAWRDDYRLRETPVTVTANEVTYADMPLSFKRNFPLAVLSYSPAVAAGEPVSCSTTIDFTFNTDVDTESFENAFHITPSVEGYFEYKDSYTKASFIPSISLEADVTYTVTLDATAKHTDPDFDHPQMEAPLSFSFATSSRNRMELVDHFPKDGGQVHTVSPTLEFRFDSNVDPANAYDALTVKDSQGNTLTMNKRTTKFNKLSNGYGNIVYGVNGNLTEGETYTLELSTILRDRENLPLAEPVGISFSAVDVTKGLEEGTVIEDFEESGIRFAYDEERSTGIGNTKPNAVRSTSDKLLGRASGKFTYKFIDNRGGDITWKYTGESEHFNTNERLSVFINGDFNSHRLYAILTSGTDTKYVDLGIVDFLGWQRREAVLDMLDPSYPYQLGGFRLVQETSPITQQGTFCIDQITRLSDNSGVDDIELGSNAVSVSTENGILHVSAPAAIRRLELYTASGLLVMAADNTDSLTLGATSPGIYLLRVSTAEGTVSIKLPVR